MLTFLRRPQGLCWKQLSLDFLALNVIFSTFFVLQVGRHGAAGVEEAGAEILKNKFTCNIYLNNAMSTPVS